MIIGIDLDDVFFETTEKILEYVKNKFGIAINKENINVFDIGKCANLNNEQIRKAVDYAISTPDIEVVKDAVYTINNLITYGHEIVFVSHRPAKLFGNTIEILSQIPYLKPNWKLELTYRNYQGAPNKATIVNKYGIDLFIEDRPDTIFDLYSRTECDILVYDQPWNRDIKDTDDKRIIRIDDWSDIRFWIRILNLINM